MLSLLKTLWRGWKGFAHKLVAGQSWLLMAIAYIVAMGPASIFIKLNKERRLDRAPADPGAATYGLTVEHRPPDVRRAQRPW